MSKDLELALRIKADFDEAKRNIDGLSSSIESISTSADTASQSAGDVSHAVDNLEKSLEKTTSTSSRMGTSFEQWNKTFAQTKQDLSDWESANNGALRSMEDIAAQEERLDRLMAQGAITMSDYEKSLKNLDAAEAKLTKEHAAQERELQRVLATADKTAAELKKLDAAAQKLNDAWRDGRIGTMEYEKAMGGIAKRRAEIDATGGSMQRLGLHTRAARNQIVTLGRDIASGNWESAATSVLRLSQGADSAAIGFARFLLPAGLIVGVLGSVAAVGYTAWKQTVELENALIISGNAAGITLGQFDSMADSVASAGNVTIGTAREISQELVRTGRFNREQIEQFGGTIAQLQRVSGESTQALVRDFSQMSNGVAKWVAERNRSMHFVTAEQYEYIRSLEQTGRVEDAQVAASQALSEHLDKNARQLGIVERAWNDLKNSASETKQSILNIGRTDDEYQLEQARSQLASARVMRTVAGPNGAPTFRAPDQDRIAELEAQVATLQSRVTAAQTQAAEQAEQSKAEEVAITARESLREQLLRINKDAQLERDLKKLQEDWAAAIAVSGANLDQSQYDALEKAIREKYSDKSISQAAKASETFVANLEKQAAAVGKTESELRKLSISEQTLTVTQRERALAADKILKVEQDRLKVLRDQQSLSDLNTQLMRAQGNEAGASEREMRSRYEKMLKPMGDAAKQQGQVIVDQLIDLNALQLRLAEAEKSISQTISRQQQQETSINTQREAGLITEAEARRRIVELHKETSAELEKQRPLLEELAQKPGAVGEAAAIVLAQLQSQAEQLNATMNLFSATMNTAIESGLTDALAGLAKGTMSFKDAVSSLADTVIDALIRISAQQIAQSMTSSVGGWVSAAGAAMGYATGGHVRGAGSGTSDSIPAMLSNGEFVARAAVVAQKDALNFLHDFNSRGMSAIRDWAPVHHSNGGLAGYPAPRAPSVPSSVALPESSSQSMEMTNRIVNVVDPSVLDDYLKGTSAEKIFLNVMSRNATVIRRSVMGGS